MVGRDNNEAVVIDAKVAQTIEEGRDEIDRTPRLTEIRPQREPRLVDETAFRIQYDRAMGKDLCGVAYRRVSRA